jgi:hypothetical protein
VRNASLICTILDEVLYDPNDELHDVETELAGLPVSILSRLFILHGEAIPALDGALLRVAAKELVKGHIFNPDSTNQIKTLLVNQRRRKLQTLARRSAKACATPSADSIDSANLFSGVFDTVFKNPDTLMLLGSFRLLRHSLRYPDFDTAWSVTFSDTCLPLSWLKLGSIMRTLHSPIHQVTTTD